MTHSPTFDPARRLCSMQDAEALVVAWGGNVKRNGCGELTFCHPLMPHPVTTNSTRRQTSDRLTAWLRQLHEARAILREAFGLKEIA